MSLEHLGNHFRAEIGEDAAEFVIPTLLGRALSASKSSMHESSLQPPRVNRSKRLANLALAKLGIKQDPFFDYGPISISPSPEVTKHEARIAAETASQEAMVNDTLGLS
jgi:hypothetical protein